MPDYRVLDEDLAGVRQIIDASRARSIDYYEISARRFDSTADGDGPDGGNVDIEVQYRVAEGGFAVRLRANLILPAGEVDVSVAAEYEMSDELQPRSRSLQLFVNEVAVMTVYPYLREAVASITSRVFGEAVHLPLVQRGELGLEVDDE